MSLSILEVLQTAEYNLVNGNTRMQREIGEQQLSNALRLLEEDADLNDEFKE